MTVPETYRSHSHGCDHSGLVGNTQGQVPLTHEKMEMKAINNSAEFIAEMNAIRKERGLRDDASVHSYFSIRSNIPSEDSWIRGEFVSSQGWIVLRETHSKGRLSAPVPKDKEFTKKDPLGLIILDQFDKDFKENEATLFLEDADFLVSQVPSVEPYTSDEWLSVIKQLFDAINEDKVIYLPADQLERKGLN